MGDVDQELPTFAPLYIESVTIKDFRGLAECHLELEPGLTVLVGRNNCGKSRILRAICIALGGAAAELDDLTVGGASRATIDVVVAPPPPTALTDEESFTDAVAQRLVDTKITSEDPYRERFAWRTTIRTSSEGFGARAEMQVLNYDMTTKSWVLPQSANSVTRQREWIAADHVQTHRDLVDELARRGSAVRRVLGDLEVPDDARADLEEQLSDFAANLISKSSTLAAVASALDLAQKSVGIGVPAVNPIPMRLEELARVASIDLDTGQGPLPARLHGSGSRSLASLQIQGVLYDRRLGQDGSAVRPHPVTLIEEPEAHLHPQASLAVVELLKSIRGQLVVSTHSSHIVTAVEPRAIRLISTDSASTRVVDLGPSSGGEPTVHRALRPDSHVEEMEKLRRFVERPFGELLFASAIVIGDGATERAFLPSVIRHALGIKASPICVIDPESMANNVTIAAVKFARLAQIPWVLFADADPPGKSAVDLLAAQVGDEVHDHVVWIQSGVDDAGAVDSVFEEMMIQYDEAVCRAACIEARPASKDSTDSTMRLMTQSKGFVGSTLARHFIDAHEDSRTWPLALRRLVDRLNVQVR